MTETDKNEGIGKMMEEKKHSGSALSSDAAARIFGKHGGYRNLLAYQVADMLYDYTCRFCDRYLPKSDRHHDQMVQSARSGYQNIGEGSEDSATSKKIEMNLTNVAKGSIAELMMDYQKYLKRRGLRLWQSGEPLFEEARALHPKTVEDAVAWVNKKDGQGASVEERAANLGAILSAQAHYLTERLLDRQARDFEENGGFSERLYQNRYKYRGTDKMEKVEKNKIDEKDTTDKIDKIQNRTAPKTIVSSIPRSKSISSVSSVLSFLFFLFFFLLSSSGVYAATGSATSALFTVDTRNTVPIITGVTPSPVPGKTVAQPFSINGGYFAQGAKVNLKDLRTGVSYLNRACTVVPPSRIDLNPNFGNVSGQWSVEVINPDGSPSGEFKFQVNGTTVGATISVEASPYYSKAVCSVGETRDLVWKISNVGNVLLNGSATITGANANMFKIISGGTYTLYPTKSQDIRVQYKPTVAGTHKATLSFSGAQGWETPLNGMAELSILAGKQFGTFIGTVTDSVSGEHVNGVRVNVVNGANGEVIVKNGNFSIQLVASDKHILNIYDPSGQYKPFQFSVTVPADGMTFQDIQLILRSNAADSRFNPVLLVRGINFDDPTPKDELEYWQAFHGELDKAGFTEVWDCNVENGVGYKSSVIDGTMDVSYNTNFLLDYIREKVRAFKLKNNGEYPEYINIVAHRMGGLIVRELLHQFIGGRNGVTVDGHSIEVKRVIMLDTPNMGTPLATVGVAIHDLGDNAVKFSADADGTLESMGRLPIGLTYGMLEFYLSIPIRALEFESLRSLTPGNLREMNAAEPWPSNVDLYLTAGTHPSGTIL